MKDESLLKELYELLKEKFEPETKEINLDTKAIKEKAFKELTEEYEKEYEKVARELLELKIEDVKELQKEKLARYCENFHIVLDIEKLNISDLSKKEKELEEKLKDMKKIVEILKGESELGETAADNIKNLGI